MSQGRCHRHKLELKDGKTSVRNVEISPSNIPRRPAYKATRQESSRGGWRGGSIRSEQGRGISRKSRENEKARRGERGDNPFESIEKKERGGGDTGRPREARDEANCEWSSLGSLECSGGGGERGRAYFGGKEISRQYAGGRLLKRRVGVSRKGGSV